MGPVEVSQAAKQIWRFGSQLSRGVWGSPAIFDVIPTTLPPAGLALGDRGPAHRAKKTKAFVATLAGRLRLFVLFLHRVIPDITHAYYAHRSAWNEIGFGGPASPRGYVRMGLDRRDPWEAVEAHPGEEATAARKNARVG
jgi:hypothetical protein